MGIKVANNAFATLAAGISNSDTSITVSTGQGARFPVLGAGDYFYATLINTSNQLEIVKCTARSTDVLTVVRAQEATAARAYDVGDRIEIRITAATFEDATAIYNVPSETTGFFAMPSGTTAQRPGSAAAGYSRFNSDTGSLEFFNGTTWIATNLIPTVNSVDGTIFAGAASTLTLSATSATDLITVRFSEGGSTLADVTPVTVTSGSASVTVPSAVFNRPAATVIAVSILNQDGTPSSNAVNKTVQALPTGGTITTSGNFRIHTFTSSSSLVVPSGLTLSNVEYLVIAGGGGGGRDNFSANRGAGGGGAGGYRSSVPSEASGGGASAEARQTLSANSYTVTVGAGGAGGLASPDTLIGVSGTDGNNSVFGSITSTGGGGGCGHGSSFAGSGRAGGSGGGSSNGGLGGAGTSGQGFVGGNGGVTDPTYNGGGGGGAAQAGAAGGPSAAGAGGNGVSSSITGTAVTRAGGGGGRGGSNGAAGGAGGGGAGALSGNATSGTVNTGGGGGGARQAVPGNGGSGIVIVRYTL